MNFSAFFDFGTGCADGKYIKVSPDTIYSDTSDYGFVPYIDEDGIEKNTITSYKTDCEGVFSDLCIGNSSDYPMTFEAKVPKSGTYNVKLYIGGYSENSDIIVLSQWRRFVINKTIKAGECFEYEFTVNVCDVHRKDEDRFIDRSVRLSVLGKNPIINAVEITETDAPTIYIGGDSTVTDQIANYPYNPQSTYCGWGQMIGQYLKKGIAVSNHAQSGLTTAEFMGIHWAVVKERLKKGDFLFIQFAHNDQKIKELDAFGGYSKNLRYYIEYAKSVGAYPVLCTPINRIIFEDDGSLRDLLGEYGMAVKAVAKEYDIPCLDLLSKTTDYFVKQGDERAWDYFWGDGVNRDYTHTNDKGGDIIARFVAQEIMRNNIDGICEYIRTDIIDVPEPTPLDPSKRRKPSREGLKPIESVGLVNVPKFTDINNMENSDKAKELSARGILDPLCDNLFGPDKMLSRKSALYWSVRSAGLECDEANAEKSGFANILTIDDNPITREELAVLLINSYNHRAPDRAIVGNIDNYTDRNTISDKYLDYVRAANELGVLKGETNSLYSPDSTFTRKEAVDIFHKLIMQQ